MSPALLATDRSTSSQRDQRENIRLDFLPEISRIVAEHAPESQFEQGYDAGVYFFRLDLTQVARAPWDRVAAAAPR
jgi:hypothetical protein